MKRRTSRALRVTAALGGLPLVALGLASVQGTSSYFYEVETYAGSIAPLPLQQVPAACLALHDLKGQQLPDVGSDAALSSLVSSSINELIRPKDLEDAGYEVVVLRTTDPDYVPGTEVTIGAHGRTPALGYLVIVASGDWTVTGSGQEDIILAGPGNTVMRGANGRDCLVGGSGTTTFQSAGPSGDNHGDLFIGGSGSNVFWTGNSKDIVIGGTGSNELSGANAPDVLIAHDACFGTEEGHGKSVVRATWSGDPANPVIGACEAGRAAAESLTATEAPQVSTLQAPAPSPAAPAPEPTAAAVEPESESEATAETTVQEPVEETTAPATDPEEAATTTTDDTSSPETQAPATATPTESAAPPPSAP